MKQLAPVCTLLVVLFVFPPRVGEERPVDAEAIGVLRAVVTAEQGYAARHRGRFTTPSCLSAAACAGGDAPMLDPAVATLPDRGGYRFTFHPVASAGADSRALTGYAITARPIDEAASHLRAFCADDSGQIVWSRAAVPPTVRDGRCHTTARRLLR